MPRNVLVSSLDQIARGDVANYNDTGIATLTGRVSISGRERDDRTLRRGRPQQEHQPPAGEPADKSIDKLGDLLAPEKPESGIAAARVHGELKRRPSSPDEPGRSRPACPGRNQAARPAKPSGPPAAKAPDQSAAKRSEQPLTKAATE